LGWSWVDGRLVRTHGRLDEEEALDHRTPKRTPRTTDDATDGHGYQTTTASERTNDANDNGSRRTTTNCTRDNL